jgi:hypothetical protein
MHGCMPVVVKRKLLQISKMILKAFKKSWGKFFNNYLAERHSDEDDTKNLEKVSCKICSAIAAKDVGNEAMCQYNAME